MMPASATEAPSPTRCPICRKDAIEAYRPFCSKRCADIDLGKWFSGGYAVAGRDGDESDLALPLPATDGERDDGE